MAPLGYHSGDPHLHFPRKTEADDRVILDLLEAEDIQFGSILAYNEPAGPYKGVMETMAAPQLRGLGKASVDPPRRDLDRLGPGISQHHLWSSQPLLARRPRAGRPEGRRQQLAALRLARPRDQKAGRLRDPRPRRLRPGDLCRLRPQERRRRRAPPVRRLPRDRAGRLVSHPQYRLSLSLRRGERLSRLPQAGRLPDLCPCQGSARLRRLAQGRGPGPELRHQRADAAARGGW